MEKVILNVSGMKCGGCESNVRDKLSAVAGVGAVAASHQDNTVTVEFDPGKTSVDVIKTVISGAGFVVS